MFCKTITIVPFHRLKRNIIRALLAKPMALFDLKEQAHSNEVTLD